MTPDQLLTFATVAELGNISHAAQALHLSQPAVSGQLRLLQESFGEPLYRRDGRGIRLTAVGEQVAVYANKLRQDYRQAMALRDSLRGMETGALRIGASTTPASYLLPYAIAEFHQRYPAVALHIIDGNTSEIVAQLDRLDVAFIEGAVPPGLSPEIIAQVVEKFIFQLEAQLADRSVSIELSDEATRWLAEKGYDEKFGARPLARVIQEYIKKPLAEELLFGKLENGGTVKVLVKGKGPDRELAFEFLPLDPSKRVRSAEDEETDDDSPQPVLADATPKKALPGPKEKGEKPKESGAVPSVPRKKKEE